MKNICKSKSELQFGAISYNSKVPVSFETLIDKLKENTGWSRNVNFTDCINKILKFINLNTAKCAE